MRYSPESPALRRVAAAVLASSLIAGGSLAGIGPVFAAGTETQSCASTMTQFRTLAQSETLDITISDSACVAVQLLPGASGTLVLNGSTPVTQDPQVPLAPGDVLTYTAPAADVTNSQEFIITTASSMVPYSITTLVTAPGAPSIVSADPASGQVTLTWSPAGFNGGAPVTDHRLEYSLDEVLWEGATLTGSSDTTGTMTGLTNGQAYFFRVQAINSAGSSSPSASYGPVTVLGVPGAPDAPSASAGDASATVTWSPPADNGGASITDYVIEYSSNGTDWATATHGALTETSLLVTGLTNGTAYTFRVAAVNSAGTGAPSAASTPVTPAAVTTAPGQVDTPALLAGDQGILASWSAPASDGGSPITDYLVEYSTDGSAWTEFTHPASTETSAEITPLVNGTAYYVRVSAVNAVGSGTASPVAGPATPAAVTTAPGKTPTPTGVAGDTLVTLSWTAPADGGSPITDYLIQFSSDSGSTWDTFTDAVGAATTVDVTGLVNGTSYIFRVGAVNAVGIGVPSDPSDAVTPVAPATVPDAPSQPTGVAGDAKVTVSWSAPAFDGGDPITDYVVEYSSDGGTGWTAFPHAAGTATTMDVTGLVNDGPTYIFRVAAVNAVGTGTFSPESAAYGPTSTPTAPGTPGAPTPVAGDGKVSLTWAPPATGGSAITDYLVEYSTDGSAWTEFTHLASPDLAIDVTGLTNGTPYTFRIAAVNAVGTGSFSAASDYATPVQAATVPAAPSSVVATADVAAVDVSWVAGSDGGSPLTGYVVEYSSDAGSTWTAVNVAADATSTRIDTLTPGVQHLFRVAAVNALGTGTYSSQASATPLAAATVPDQPAAPSGSAGDAQVQLTWAAPADGGSTITAYVVQGSLDGGLSWSSVATTAGDVTTVTLTGLVNGQGYLFRVGAVNTVGSSAFSAASATLTPSAVAAVPSAPAKPSAVAGSGSVTLSWSAPSANGASITDYRVRYSSNGGGSWVDVSASVSTALSRQVSGLTNGTPYVFQVAAVNAVGVGAFSASSDAVTPVAATAPSQPSAPTATAGDAKVTLSWVAPAANGAEISNYLIEYSSNSGSTWTAFSRSASTATTAEVTGLTNGTAYVFRVAAVNAAGTSAYSAASAAVTPVAATPTPTTPTDPSASDPQKNPSGENPSGPVSPAGGIKPAPKVDGKKTWAKDAATSPKTAQTQWLYSGASYDLVMRGGLPRGRGVVTVSVDGKWVPLGKVKVSRSGTAVLPTFTAVKPGTYMLKISLKGKAPRYLRLVIKDPSTMTPPTTGGTTGGTTTPGTSNGSTGSTGGSTSGGSTSGGSTSGGSTTRR